MGIKLLICGTELQHHDRQGEQPPQPVPLRNCRKQQHTADDAASQIAQGRRAVPACRLPQLPQKDTIGQGNQKCQHISNDSGSWKRSRHSIHGQNVAENTGSHQPEQQPQPLGQHRGIPVQPRPALPLCLHGPQPVLGHISSPQGTAGRKGAGHTCRMPLLPAAVRNGTAAGKPAPRPILTAGTVQLLFPGTCVAHSPADALHRQCLPLFF